MRVLKRRGVGCRLKVVGSDPDGTILNGYRKKTSDLPVEFTGLLNSEETLEVVSGASFFVLPCIEAANGDRDGIPVALIEAMGMGVPCVSTVISGVPELIENGVSGILVRPGSSTRLAEAMENLIVENELSQRIGEESRKKVICNHSPEEQAQILFDSFSRITTEGKRI